GGFIELFAGEKTLIDSKNLPSLNKPLKKSKVDSTISPSPLPTLKTTPNSTIRPTTSATPTPTPVVIKTASPSPSPTPTPTPVPKPAITSVTPTKLQKPGSGNTEFAINGQYLTGAKAVFLDQLELQFFVVDSFTIFATVGPNIGPGIYDVSVTGANGDKLTLYRVLEVQ
ncbi:MAG: hypothetical protein Q7K39_04840, partial [Candidatus Magasanikbacteria bacterium]|nr:hypothetical protein [Candidatus Magasanikbacteria bacterium]